MRRLAAGLLLLGLALSALALSCIGKSTKDLMLTEGAQEAVDWRLSLALEAFDIPRYSSGRPQQYVSVVRVLDRADGALRAAKISVNHPLQTAGWWIYQFDCGQDQTGAPCTRLRCVKDPLLPVAAVGGGLVLLGALLLGWARRRDFAHGLVTFVPPWKRLLRWVAAIVVVALPVVIIGRAVLRPEPVPALQSWLMAPHVAAYSVSYLLLMFANFGIGRRFVPLGFVLMTFGLVLGAVWGKFVWSDWWQFDPKENWSFVTWLAFAVCLLSPADSKVARWSLHIGTALIVVTLTWVNFSRFAVGLHSYVSTHNYPLPTAPCQLQTSNSPLQLTRCRA